MSVPDPLEYLTSSPLENVLDVTILLLVTSFTALSSASNVTWLFADRFIADPPFVAASLNVFAVAEAMK